MKSGKIIHFGHKKLTAYFTDLIRSDEFLVFTKNLRKKYGIPPRGYSWNTNQKHHEFPPKRWLEVYSSKYGDLIKELIEFCEKKDLFFADYTQSLQYLIFADISKRPFNVPDFHFLLMASDVLEEKKWERPKELIANEDTIFPIALRVSPYASKRDILEYVAKNYTFEIKPVQDKYRSKDLKIGKVRVKDPEIQERNDFIYKNKHLPRKNITRLLSERYGTGDKFLLDEGAIGKIISLERHKRKEV